jgi:hypothetical protein
VFVLVTSPHASAEIQGSEANALLKWKSSFDNQSRASLSSLINPCSWEGITCDDNSTSIYEVNLANIGLRGMLQSLNFLSLPKLRSLVLSHNSFYGVIPHTFGMMSNLKTLNLSFNKLSGNISNSIGNMSKLSYLDLGGNALTGIIPVTIEKITNLSHLDIGGNNLYGNIPQRVWKMDLKYLSLAYNNFNGFISQDIFKLQNLEILYLQESGISGSMPVELQMMRNLKEHYN